MTGKERAPRNRTLQLTEPERKEFFSRCLIPVKSALTLPEITCRTLCGDFFKSAALLPRQAVSLHNMKHLHYRSDMKHSLRSYDERMEYESVISA